MGASASHPRSGAGSRAARVALTMCACAGAMAGGAHAQSDVLPAPSDPASTRGTARMPTAMPSIPVDQPQVIFFPPNPPPLGVLVNLPAAGASPSRPSTTAPAPLRAFITDSIYAPLSSHLYYSGFGGRNNDVVPTMKEKDRVAYEGYVALRTALLAELRTRVHALSRADAGLRRSEFEALARTQADRLAHLEETAEYLRAGLARAVNWYELRQWKLGRNELKKPREENRVLELQVLRAAAFYQEELSPAQRRLLREYVMQREEEVFARNEIVPIEQYFLFFLPETARFRLPDPVSPDLAARIDAFRREKFALKQEIADALYELDAVVFASTRRSGLAELARRQAARLTALETTAESLRADLITAPGLRRWPPLAPLPVVLAGMIESYQRDRASWNARRDAHGRRAANAGEPAPPRSAPPDERRAWRERSDARARTAEAQFDREHADEREALDHRLEAIRDALTEVAGTRAGLGRGHAPESFLTEFLDGRRQQDAYYEYHVAVLEPGLSAAQRRLLFGGAVERLELPLPPPELQPVYAPRTMLR